MSIVTSTLDARASSVGAAWIGFWPLGGVLSEHESMPLLTELGEACGPAAINMALLTELYA
jgi:hypothetical protein